MAAKSPSLEIISNSNHSGGTKPPAIADGERRRLPRLNLSAEQFRLNENGKVFSVSDLSDAGMAFRVVEPSDLVLFSVGAAFEGTLNLRGNKHTFEAQVRHVRIDLVGCQFTRFADGMREALVRFLDPVTLGAELKPTPPVDASTIWYHGPSGTDFIMVRGIDGSFRRFTLHVLGSYVQWDSDSGISTGVSRASSTRSENRGAMRFETLLLDADPRVDTGKLAIAKTVLMSSNLSQELMKWCIRQLTIT